MKERVFCVFLALFFSLFAVACAEDTSVARSTKYDAEGFTLEVDQYDFKFFLPASFEPDPDSPGEYKPTDGSWFPSIQIVSTPHVAVPLEREYTNREQLLSFLEGFASSLSNCRVIQMDECLGLMHYGKPDRIAAVIVNATNRKNTCEVIVFSTSLDEALELAQGIIDHAVAKEIPLEELDSMSAVYTPKYDDADYTYEAVYNDFHLFMPSSLKNIEEDAIHYFYDSDSSLRVFFWVKNDNEPQRSAFYSTQDELLEQLKEGVNKNPDSSIIQMDECFGYISKSTDENGYLVDVCVSNRKNLLPFTVFSESLDEALELAQGIIDHAVAKEVPLQELEQAE